MTRDTTLQYDPKVSLKNVEEKWISKAIIHHRGNMQAAAQSLEISRATLYRKLQRIQKNSIAREANGNQQAG